MRIRFALTALVLTVPLSGCLTLAGAYTLGVMGSFAIVDEHSREDRNMHLNPFIALDPHAPRAVPPMDEARKVNEQDCSKPIADWSANLSCR